MKELLRIYQRGFIDNRLYLYTMSGFKYKLIPVIVLGRNAFQVYLDFSPAMLPHPFPQVLTTSPIPFIYPLARPIKNGFRERSRLRLFEWPPKSLLYSEFCNLPLMDTPV